MLIDHWHQMYNDTGNGAKGKKTGQRANTLSWNPSWTPGAWTGSCSSGGRGGSVGMQRWSVQSPLSTCLTALAKPQTSSQHAGWTVLDPLRDKSHQEHMWDVFWCSLVSLMLTPVCRSKDLSAWDRAPLLQGVLRPWQPTQVDLRGSQSGLQNGRRRAAQHRNGKRAAADREVHPSAPGCRWRLLDRPPAQSRALPGWHKPSMPLPVLLAGWQQG